MHKEVVLLIDLGDLIICIERNDRNASFNGDIRDRFQLNPNSLDRKSVV